MTSLAFDMIPHVGLGPVHLGADRAAVRASLARVGVSLTATRGSVDYFADSALTVDYRNDGACFLGVASGAPFLCRIDGIDPFDIAADALFAHLAEQDGGHHEYDEYEYIFPSRIVTLWDADTQYDRRRRAAGREDLRVIWGQVGIGNADYLEALDRHR